MSFYDDGGNDLQDWEVDATDFDTEDTQDKGGAVTKPGRYHVFCKDVKFEDVEGKARCFRLDLQVLAGTESDQANRMIFERINVEKFDRDTNERVPLTGKAKAITTRLFIGVGLLPEDAARSGKVSWPFTKLKGRQFIADVTIEKYTRRDGGQGSNARIAFGRTYQLGDERVADVPVDPEAAALVLGNSAASQVDQSAFSDI